MTTVRQTLGKTRPPDRPLSAHQWFVGVLATVGSQSLDGDLWQCPAHRDSSPSLSVRVIGGRLSVHCFAGCGLRRILAALRLHELPRDGGARVDPATFAHDVAKLSINFPDVEDDRGHPLTRGFRLESTHDYGRALLLRYRSPAGKKDLRWESYNHRGELVPCLVEGIALDDLPLYREREVVQAIGAGEPVIGVESETSADAIKGFGVTTWAGGAGDIRFRRLRQILGGYPHSLYIPDPDPPGLKCRDQLMAAGIFQHCWTPPEGQKARHLYWTLGHQAFETQVRAIVHPQRMREAA